MPLKILHTADLHLGMKFSTYADYPEVQSKLIEARFAALERLVERANAESCQLLVVAGDLFDRPAVAKKHVARAAAALNKFDGQLVALLPGNHDFITADQGGVWALLKEQLVNGQGGQHLLVLGSAQAYDLERYDLDAVLYAAPCASKHSKKNLLAQLASRLDKGAATVHLGVAHGSLSGVSPDPQGIYFPMTAAELERQSYDLWLLGHNHTPYPPSPEAAGRIFYAGTPEPDGFDCAHRGAAWLLQIDEKKKLQAQLIEPGEYRFSHDAQEVRSAEEIKALAAKYQGEPAKKLLLKLALSGRLPRPDYAEISELQKKLDGALCYLALNYDGLAEELTPALIEAEFARGSFPHRLLNELQGDPEALAAAYHLLREVRK